MTTKGIKKRMRLLAKAILPYPILRILLETVGYFANPMMRAEIRGNRKLRLQFNGRRCFILGNGPSLRKEDLGRLRNEIIFTCNNIGKSGLVDDLIPFAHFMTDVRMVNGEDASVRKARIADNIRLLKRQGTLPMLFLGYGLRDFAVESGLTEEFNIHYIFQSIYDYDTEYTPDLSRSIPSTPTVVQAAILTALYMGFSEIYLLGCDCTGFLSLATASSDADHSQMPYAYSTDETDRKIISNVMSQSTVSEELSSYARLFRDYRLMGAYCKKKNVKLVNLSSGGILNEIPRARLEDVIPGAAEDEVDD